jgi:hypothetical protein
VRVVPVKRIKVTEYVCDGCGGTQVVTDPLDVIGFSGVVSEQWSYGGTGSVKFFACASACLQLAIGQALEKSYK